MCVHLRERHSVLTTYPPNSIRFGVTFEGFQCTHLVHGHVGDVAPQLTDDGFQCLTHWPQRREVGDERRCSEPPHQRRHFRRPALEEKEREAAGTRVGGEAPEAA